MAALVTPTNLQKIEFDVTTAEGPSRMTVVTGMMQMVLTASSQGPFATQKESYKVLLDPTLTPGQFRKASAIASLSSIVHSQNAGEPYTAGRHIDDAQATLDDETGKVQLVVNVTATAFGPSMITIVQSLMFQVTTLAKV